jgi:hypothetical protein
VPDLASRANASCQRSSGTSARPAPTCSPLVPSAITGATCSMTVASSVSRSVTTMSRPDTRSIVVLFPALSDRAITQHRPVEVNGRSQIE